MRIIKTKGNQSAGRLLIPSLSACDSKKVDFKGANDLCLGIRKGGCQGTVNSEKIALV